MKLLLKDLKPGDEFEYVNTARHYRKGKFVVLNSVGSYLEPSAREGGIFIFSFTTNKVCQHWGQLDVNLISKTEENNMENKMGHFEGWKFGVLVQIRNRYNSTNREGEKRLVWENDLGFRTITESGLMDHYAKDTFSYELIPHKYSGFSLRFPVCRNKNETAFCNSTGDMTTIGVTLLAMEPYSYPVPTATLNIDGKIIELSAETTAELKKKLGV